ncbi:hypothetical protein FGO68_gene16296 [Halteria grandinella]|uniref:Uncharacterized protein n=1 Tax=Halteria grandinella TaxID=5974 RepID=A0A8J8P4G5_HALGN|nr:hypothetical protein FGO68_gene16296 [Halteria grandinella]
MLKFSECIDIKIVSRDTNAIDVPLKNLDRLCQCLILVLYKFREKDSQLNIRFRLTLDDCKYFCVLFLCNDISVRQEIEQLPKVELKHFFQFLDNIDKFEQITFSEMVLYEYNEQKDYARRYNQITKYIIILNQAKQKVKKIRLIRCTLRDDFTTFFPNIYPSVETVIYENCDIVEPVKFGFYQNQKVLKIINCVTFTSTKVSENNFKFTKTNNGVTFEIIEKLLSKGTDPAQLQQKYISPLKELEADVYFGTYLNSSQSYPLQLITSIENCKLRDNETVFSYAMIKTLLDSTLQIENASFLPPIQLQISRFKEIGTINESQSIKSLMNIAELNGLSIIGFQEIFTREKLTIYTIQIKLPSLEGRQLSLKIKGIIQ